MRPLWLILCLFQHEIDILSEETKSFLYSQTSSFPAPSSTILYKMYMLIALLIWFVKSTLETHLWQSRNMFIWWHKSSSQTIRYPVSLMVRIYLFTAYYHSVRQLQSRYDQREEPTNLYFLLVGELATHKQCCIVASLVWEIPSTVCSAIR